MIDTKERILETAERSFAENGYAATSLRSIIGEAGVNLAAVHYHFGSKEELLKAVILRRAEPVNARRLALLDECESRAGGRPDLEKFWKPSSRPPSTWPMQPGGSQFVRLMGRMYAETDMLPQIVEERVRPHADALPRCPSRRAAGAARRTSCCGACSSAPAPGPHPARVRHARVHVPAPGTLTAVQAPLIQFICAGLRAPVHALEEK